jgi:hypothetical protein
MRYVIPPFKYEIPQITDAASVRPWYFAIKNNYQWLEEQAIRRGTTAVEEFRRDPVVVGLRSMIDSAWELSQGTWQGTPLPASNALPNVIRLIDSINDTIYEVHGIVFPGSGPGREAPEPGPDLANEARRREHWRAVGVEAAKAAAVFGAFMGLFALMSLYGRRK